MDSGEMNGDVAAEDDTQNTIGSEADFDDHLEVPDILYIDDADGEHQELEIIEAAESNFLCLYYVTHTCNYFNYSL